MPVANPRALIDDRPEDGVFRVHKDAFRNQEIFDLEMKHIFEGTWVFVGLASEVPKPHDFFTTTVGRHPVIVMRDRQGTLGAFVNSCRHRGARICPHEKGNRRRHTCPYHGWTYDSGGRLWNLKDKDEGGYSAAFDLEDHDLARVPRFEEYRGFLYASFNPEVLPLDEHLGDARVLIDLLCDQSPVGELELVPGRGLYTFEANWKMQLENCTDGYHFLNTHISYFNILQRRIKVDNHGVSKTIFDDTKPYWEEEQQVIGNFTLPHGIAVSWVPTEPQPNVPLYASMAEVGKRVGQTRLRWMFNGRNTTIFPNMQLAAGFSTQLRVMRPISPGKTEMNTYCLAPVGESAEARRQRIRQYEDFFSPSGIASPDDNTVYEECQVGNNSDVANWHQGYMRGMTVRNQGANIVARELGITPSGFTESGFHLQEEVIFHALYREWLRLLSAGAEGPAEVSTIEECA
jgi:benzoate/toluate 1,2-dioxygenase subunit alpha